MTHHILTTHRPQPIHDQDCVCVAAGSRSLKSHLTDRRLWITACWFVPLAGAGFGAFLGLMFVISN